MKRLIVCSLCVIFIMVLLPDLIGTAERENVFYSKQCQTDLFKKINLEREEKKRRRYEMDRERIEVKLFKHSMSISAPGIDRVNSVDIQGNTSSMNAIADYSGDYVFLGSCVNAGTTAACFVKVNIKMYDASDNFIDSDYSYIAGGTNVKLSSDIYTNALLPGETGFFKVWTNYDYSQVSWIQWWFTYDTYSYSNCHASLSFYGSPSFSPDYSDDLYVNGLIKNSSNTYLTYFTQAYFAIFDSSGKMVDKDFTYVDGSTYNYGSGNTDTAVYPGETMPFDNYFNTAYSSYSSYLSSFEWDETTASTLPEKDPPFGQFATPLDNSSVSSSIAVTGWALDDSGVENVKIYRKQGSSLVYIGDASFVEGARPDVAALYPQYPNNTKAGWGYMMLTNFLPNGGNGTFEIHAIATDAVGKTTTLGTKTILCDNANAVKPFGAIDTPTQGGTATGSAYRNQGWVLTPMPNSIPTDGSTINVYVDGVYLGRPTYNIYRADIAGLFPGYYNSNGAHAYFNFDTTTYADGVHTIYWTARDNAGNTDGIGSRYLTIQNTGGSRAKSASTPVVRFDLPQISQLPVDFSNPIRVKRGYGKHIEPRIITPNDKGITRINIKELERIEIQLTEIESDVSGSLIVGDLLGGLPIGSTLKDGTFYWAPGFGFFGNYRFVFVVRDQNGDLSKMEIILNIVPKFGLKK